MNTAQQTLSLSLLGVMAIAFAPLASAAGFGFGMRDQIDADTKAELQACHQDNAGDHEAMKTCADAVFEANGIEKPERPERPEISEEAKEALKTCKKNNTEDREAAKACAETVAEQYDIELPQKHMRRRGMKMGHMFGGRSNVDPAILRTALQGCIALDDEEIHACVMGALRQ